MAAEAAFVMVSFLLDWWLGDPRWLPHPVVGMGKAIAFLDRALRRMIQARGWNHTEHSRRIRLVGMLLPLVIAGGVFGLVWYAVRMAESIDHWIGTVLEIILVWTAIAPKGLADAGMRIYRALRENDLPRARMELSMVVGRDTERLDEPEIVRGGVETVAENIVDAVVSPLFYAVIGGAPLAMAYRAINTLDSMVGYKNERYLHLGWASARLDDVANYVPARLVILPMTLAIFLLRLNPVRALRTWWRDAKGHPSPNSGIPEALMAGALGIQLGGTNTYRGVVSDRARLGEDIHKKRAEHVVMAVRVLWWTTIFTLLLFAGAAWLVKVV